MVIVLVIVCCYALNHFGEHKLAKVLGLLFFNLIFGLYTLVLPQDMGIYLFYFPLIAASSAIFDNHEKNYRISFIILSLSMLVLLFAADLDLTGSFKLDMLGDTHGFFVMNILSSAIILVLCIDFMLQINEASEGQLKELAEKIRVQNVNLEKTNTELDRFLYSTSHDLRSPLASIKGLINVAKYDTSDVRIHGYFNMMVDRVDKLDLFVRDIIDYSKNARTELRPEPVDFNNLIYDITENLKFIDGADRIEFKKEVVLDHCVQLDKGRLMVVLNNLISNAIKYHDFRKDDPWIKIAIQNTNGTIKLSISDNGMGIGEEHHAKIFNMFYRGTVQSQGSGLGLYIVKEAVEKMHGTIKLASKEGEGTTFSIVLPICES
jgi:signal transduction histidine kinase